MVTKTRSIALIVGASVWIGCIADGHGQTAAFFTNEQAAQGASEYASNCSRCHGGYLQGAEFGPPLRGGTFIQHWSGRSVESLFSLIKTSMPPGEAGTFSDTTYAQIIAYLLEVYGIQPGTQPLPSEAGALSKLRMPDKDTMERHVGGPGGGLAPGAKLPAWPARTNPLDKFTPVTEAVLAEPPDGSWPSWRRTREGLGFSPLRQITRENVQRLRVAWTLALPEGQNEATPLVHDGVIFVHSYGDHVAALDAVNGDELWHFHHTLAPGISPLVHRNIALYGDKVFFATSDSHMVALNAKTGEVVWQQSLGGNLHGAPVVAKGVVMQGAGDAGRPGGAHIVGLDAKDGDVLWRFNTIARPGEPNGNSWNGLPLEKRSGGSVWTAGSYDAALGLAFFGPAPTYDTEPLRIPVNRRGVSNDALYTNTTVAIDPSTGRLVWHYQHLPNDQWDLDWAFERQLMNLRINGASQKLVVTAGKLAIYDALDAATGKYMFSMDLGLQNLVIAIDPTNGKKAVDLALTPSRGQKVTVCPHASGGKSWSPGSYNLTTHILYVPLVEACMDFVPVPKGHGLLSSGVEMMLRPAPGSDGKYGRLQAINMQTRKAVWTHRQRAPLTTGVLATAGDLVFAGALDRWFAAYDAGTGELLWRIRLSDVPNSAPISFSANGRQYIAIVTGSGGYGNVAAFPPLVPEIPMPSGNNSAIWTFELPE